MISALVTLIVIGLIVALAFYVLKEFPPPEPINKLLRVVIIVVGIIAIIMVLLRLGGVHLTI